MWHRHMVNIKEGVVVLIISDRLVQIPESYFGKTMGREIEHILQMRYTNLKIRSM
jgi:hypothetical protein